MANQNYDKAIATTPDLPEEEVARVLASSSHFRNAMQDARKLPQFGNLGNTDMRLWDQVYKKLGSQSRQHTNDGTDRANFGKMQSMLGDFIGEHNPEYMVAVRQFADDSSLIDAITLGRGVLAKKAEAEATVDMIVAMGEGERQSFIIGVRQAVVDLVENVPNGADAANRIINRPGVRNRLKAAFGGGKSGANEAEILANRQAANRYDEFRKLLRAETTMSKNKNRLIGGSDTARRLGNAEEMVDVAEPMIQAAAGNVPGAVQGAGRSLLKYLRTPPQKTRDAGRVLFTDNQKKNQAFLAKLKRDEIRRAAQSRGDIVEPMQPGQQEPVVRRGFGPVLGRPSPYYRNPR